MEETLLMHVSAADRSGGTDGKFTITNQQPIRFNRSNQARIYINAASIPLSFYNIPANHNTCQILIHNVSLNTDTTYTITITPGNYTLNTLLTAFETALQVYVGTAAITLNTTTLKYTIDTGDANLLIRFVQPSGQLSNKVARSMGFYYYDYTYEPCRYKVYIDTPAQTITSTNIPQLDITEIAVHTSFSEQGICRGRISHISEVIILDVPQNGMMSWYSKLKHKFSVNESQANSFEVEFYRQDICATVDFNGVPPSLTFAIDLLN